MADTKISSLTAYTTPINTDLFPIVDITTPATKKITVSSFLSSLPTSLISDTDSTDDLGSSSKYWANGYVDKIFLNATATLAGTTAGAIHIVGNVGIGTSTPDQNLHVVGNFMIEDTVAAKGYRFRTSGGDLDFDFAAKDMYFSGYTGADFTGTQKQYLAFGGEYDFVSAKGNWEFKDRATGAVVYQMNPDGNVIFNANSATTHDFTVKTDVYDAVFIDASNDSIVVMSNASGKLGFHGATAIVKQTGVAVTAAGIHAALVSLGLIAA